MTINRTTQPEGERMARFRELTEEELRWAKVHVMADKRKPLPEWWGKRR